MTGIAQRFLTAVALIAACGAASAQTYTYSGSVVDTTVVTTGIYDILAAGAAGAGASGTIGGLGAAVGGDVFLTAGTQLDLVVGGEGQNGNFGNVNGGGGGGGSFVFVVGATNPLLVAGGGGGAAYIGGNGGNGQITTFGQTGFGTDGGAGGTAGSGGTGGSDSAYNGGGGGGWLNNGTGGSGGITESSGPGGNGLPTFIGGSGNGCPANTPTGCTNGGFGGGGAGGWQGGGGGGGYSGGGGGDGIPGSGGGGGGSYIDPSFTNVTMTAGNQSGNGDINISLVSGATAVPEIDPASAASGLTLLVGALVVLRGRKQRSIAA